jgi:hypothetical protein
MRRVFVGDSLQYKAGKPAPVWWSRSMALPARLRSPNDRSYSQPQAEDGTMAKFLFVYHGGSYPESKEEQAKVMEAWGQWFGFIGKGLIDGGNPVGKSSTVHSNGSVTSDGGANPASGYSLIEARSLDDALAYAKQCPLLKAGGSVEIAQAMDM